MAASDDDVGPLPRACGAYTLKSVLGAGGMAIVYRAEHTLLGQEVAIKMIRKHYAAEPAVIAFFQSELQALVHIRHPNVVEVQNVFESEHGEKCLVMELLEARTLRDMLEKNEPLLFPDVLHLAQQVAQALLAAHAAGVIHRDLKPDNVAVLQRSGVDEQRLFVKVLDFGVARLKTEQRDQEQIVGTLAYIAPELLRGAPADPRSDAYSLGVLLYELVSGALPFDPKSAAELRGPRPPILPLQRVRPDLPVELLELVMSCMAEEPMMRPASMQEVVNVIDRLRHRQATYVHTSWYTTQRRPMLPVFAWAAAFVVTLGLAYWWQTRKIDAPAPSIVPAAVAAPSPSPAPVVALPSTPRRTTLPRSPAARVPDPKPRATVRVTSTPSPVQPLPETESFDDPSGEDVPEIR